MPHPLPATFSEQSQIFNIAYNFSTRARFRTTLTNEVNSRVEFITNAEFIGVSAETI
jgi:hypothetical protein